jgi:hypothetical protein
MEMEIPLQCDPDPKFAGVARSIAKGDAPKWLVVGLTHFSPGIGSDDTSDVDLNTVVEQMQGATDTLIKWLPMYLGLGFGLPCPEEVAIALRVLPRIKEDLDRLAIKRMGRPPNAQRDMCAAVVALAWKLLYGKIEPQSLRLQEACGEYWRAGGGKQIGEWDLAENWRRPIERAMTADYSWVEDFLVAVQKSP